jgi:hypothetical protein
MRVRLVGHQGEACMNTGSSGPWHEFVEVLANKGCEIVKDDFGTHVDLLIANTHSQKGIDEANKSKVPNKMKHLILWEPPVIDYKRHSDKVLSQYGVIWSPTIYWARKHNTRHFNWPQLFLEQQEENLENWSLRNNKSVMVLANKFSATKGELYTLRRELGIHTAKSSIMDLYGEKWNLGRYYSLRHYFGSLIRTPFWKISFKSWRYLGKSQKNYNGPSENKITTCKKYRVAVVIENSADYISEKFFDAYASGTIVIYIGPSLNQFGIPDDTAIQIGPDKNLIIKKINELLSLSTEEQYKISRNQLTNIMSISTQWHNDTVMKKLATNIYHASIEQQKH